MKRKKASLSVIFLFVILIISMILVGSAPFLTYKIVNRSPLLINPSEKHELNNYSGLCHVSFSVDQTEDYENIKKMGVKWTRIDLNWDRIEQIPGFFNFSYFDKMLSALDINDILIDGLLLFDNDAVTTKNNDTNLRYIAPGDVPLFLNYVNKTIRRYYKIVDAWEIWNEPNIPKFWGGNSEDFYYLLRQTLLLIDEIERDLNINIFILAPSATGGVMGYIPPEFEAYLKMGLGSYIDAMNFHVYQYNAESLKESILDFEAILKKYNYKGELWLTEIGNPTGGEYAWQVNQKELASNIVKTYTISTALGVNKVFWYTYKDSSSDWYASEGHFGLLYSNRTWKPGAYAYGVFNNQCDNSVYDPEMLKIVGSMVRTDYIFALFQKNNSLEEEVTLVGWFDPLMPRKMGRFSLDQSQIEGNISEYNIFNGNRTIIDGESIEIDSIPKIFKFRLKDPSIPVVITIKDPILVQYTIPLLSFLVIACISISLIKDLPFKKHS